MIRHCLTLVAGLIVLGSSGYAQDDFNAWCTAGTSKMAQFLPKPVSGLITQAPWNPSQPNDAEKTCGDATQNWKYSKLRAEQLWWFDDPELAKDATLQSKARTLQIQIHGNESLSATMYRTRQQRQTSGTIKGHTVYRAADKTLGTAGAPDVFLVVFLGPEGFNNPAVEVASLPAGPKCITVMAWLHTRADKAQADEAVARKMLEAVDYDGLAKLIEP